MDQINGIPVMLDVTGKRCVIVGGGRVAFRRAQTLLKAGAEVLVIAPQVMPEIIELGASVDTRPCDLADMEGAFFVVLATDDARVNHALAERASACGAIVNRADQAPLGDLTFMTAHRDGPLTIAVQTGGASAAAAVRIRDSLAEQLDPDWARLLTLAQPVRTQIQQQISDPEKRAHLLRRLTDDQAMLALKTGGEPALKTLYADIIRDSA